MWALSIPCACMCCVCMCVCRCCVCACACACTPVYIYIYIYMATGPKMYSKLFWPTLLITGALELVTLDLSGLIKDGEGNSAGRLLDIIIFYSADLIHPLNHKAAPSTIPALPMNFTCGWASQSCSHHDVLWGVIFHCMRDFSFFPVWPKCHVQTYLHRSTCFPNQNARHHSSS